MPTFGQKCDDRKELGMTTSSPLTYQLQLWETTSKEGNSLRVFMAWRKRYRAHGSFAYAHPETTLHRQLSTADNLLLALGEPSDGLSASEKDLFIRKVMEREGLSALLPWCEVGDLYPAGLTPQAKTIAAICCALLTRSQEVLIDLADSHLEDGCRTQLLQVLSTLKCTIVLATHHPQHWSSHIPQSFNPFCPVVTIKKVA